VLVLDNPTRGVDAGAKEEIYALIRSLTADGVAIILITDELLELIGLANRIVIMRHGRISAVVRRRASQADRTRPGGADAGRRRRAALRDRRRLRPAPSMTDTGSAPARLPLARRSAMSVGMWLPIAVVLALVGFFSVASGAFLTLRNLTAISGQSSALLLACLGATFVILMGSIDLSVGAMVLLVGSVTVVLINALGLGVEAVLVGIAIGAVLGLANGLVFAFGTIPPSS